MEFAKRALAAGWKYWYGTVGYKATQSLLNSKARQYPAHYTAGRMGTYWKPHCHGYSVFNGKQ